MAMAMAMEMGMEMEMEIGDSVHLISFCNSLCFQHISIQNRRYSHIFQNLLISMTMPPLIPLFARSYVRAWCVIAAAALMASYVSAGGGGPPLPSPTTVSDLDLDSFIGRWYQAGSNFNAWALIEGFGKCATAECNNERLNTM